MSDLISRKAAIDALRTCYDTEAITYTNGNEYISYDQALDLIDEIPSAQPETHEKRTETHACDCISRQAAIDAFCSHCYVSRPETCSTIQNGDKWCEEVYAIINLPSAQPEIIRCKDCKLHGTNGHRLNCAMFCCTMPDDGFCSCGERREDG